MFSHGITASSNESSEAAIASAVAEASADFGDEAKSVHIIVTSIIELNGMWIATVLVLVTPDLDEELQDDLKEEEKLQIKDQHLEDNREEALNADYDLLEFIEEDGIGIHIYFLIEHEDHMHSFEYTINHTSKYAQAGDFYFHLIEEGPLWEAVKDHPLDIEFYEATHTQELTLRTEDNRKFQENIKAPRLQQKMRGALQELEPE